MAHGCQQPHQGGHDPQQSRSAPPPRRGSGRRRHPPSCPCRIEGHTGQQAREPAREETSIMPPPDTGRGAWRPAAPLSPRGWRTATPPAGCQRARRSRRRARTDGDGGRDQLDGGGVQHHQQAQLVAGHAVACPGPCGGPPGCPGAWRRCPGPAGWRRHWRRPLPGSPVPAGLGQQPPQQRTERPGQGAGESRTAFMISMTPLQRHRTPAMERLSSTAAEAPSRAASATASRFPVTSAEDQRQNHHPSPYPSSLP